MKKILILILLSVSFIFAEINFNTASKEKLMTYKGIGPKKADKIIKYRKKNRIKNVNDLLNIKGIGPGIIENIKVGKQVSKIKYEVKKKKSNIDDSKKAKIKKVKKSKNLTKEQKTAKKKAIKTKAKEKKKKVVKKSKAKKVKKQAKKKSKKEKK